MKRPLRQFILKRFRIPTEKKVDEDIEWVCDTLGFISSRDKEKTAFKILRALIHSAKEEKGLTSEELTRIVEPTIGSVIYHLKKLMKAGLVVKLGSAYELRMGSLLRTIEEIEREIDITLDDIKRVAKDVDEKIGLAHR